jgi:hypothetical protein
MERIAHRDLTDPESLGQVALAEKPVACSQFALADEQLDLVEDY